MKACKFQTMQNNKSAFINFEPIWCHDINKLYILSQGNFKLVGGAGSTTGGSGLDLNAIDNLATIGLKQHQAVNKLGYLCLKISLHNIGELQLKCTFVYLQTTRYYWCRRHFHWPL